MDNMYSTSINKSLDAIHIMIVQYAASLHACRCRYIIEHFVKVPLDQTHLYSISQNSAKSAICSDDAENKVECYKQNVYQ